MHPFSRPLDRTSALARREHGGPVRPDLVADTGDRIGRRPRDGGTARPAADRRAGPGDRAFWWTGGIASASCWPPTGWSPWPPWCWPSSYFTGVATTGIVFLILFLRGLGGAFHSPAMLASTSLMVPGEHLTRIQGLNQMLQGGINIVSAPLGGVAPGPPSNDGSDAGRRGDGHGRDRASRLHPCASSAARRRGGDRGCSLDLERDDRGIPLPRGAEGAHEPHRHRRLDQHVPGAGLLPAAAAGLPGTRRGCAAARMDDLRLRYRDDCRGDRPRGSGEEPGAGS